MSIAMSAVYSHGDTSAGNYPGNKFLIYNGAIYLFAGNDVHKSTTGQSGSWSEIDTNIAADWIFDAIEFGGKMYVATGNDPGLVLSSANGTDWDIEETFTGYNLAVSLAVFNGYLYAGFAYEAGDYDLYRSSNGSDWSEVASDLDGSIFALHASSDYLYVGTGNGSIYRSSDGTTWGSPVQSGLDTWVSEIGEGADGTLYAGTYTDGRIYTSSDGSTWTLKDDLHPDPEAPSWNILVVRALAEATYVGTGHVNGTLYSTTDSGETYTEEWENTGTDYGINDITAFGGYILVSTEDGKVYSSDDSGYELPSAGVPKSFPWERWNWSW